MEVRGLAEAAADPQIKQTLTEMAESYNKLVEEADRIAHLRTALEKDGGR
jgi:hypothetical protein